MSENKTNCLISIPNFGAVRVKVTRVVHGMSVVQYSTSGLSRRGEAFYASKRTSGSFEITAVFTSRDGYERVANWLTRYSKWASNPKTTGQAVRVVIPLRDFDKVGVLESGITWGDRVGASSWPMVLSFVGSRDPLELTNQHLSFFSLGKRAKADEAVPYFYPAGTQLENNESVFDGLGDDLPNLIDDVPIRFPHEPPGGFGNT